MTVLPSPTPSLWLPDWWRRRRKQLDLLRLKTAGVMMSCCCTGVAQCTGDVPEVSAPLTTNNECPDCPAQYEVVGDAPQKAGFAAICGTMADFLEPDQGLPNPTPPSDYTMTGILDQHATDRCAWTEDPVGMVSFPAWKGKFVDRIRILPVFDAFSSGIWQWNLQIFDNNFGGAIWNGFRDAGTCPCGTYTANCAASIPQTYDVVEVP